MNDIGKYERLMISLLFLDLIINEKSFSPSGTTANIKEQSTYMFFKDLLEEIICEGAMCIFLYVFSYLYCCWCGRLALATYH